ncbi:hypothetical protein LWI28_004713 [Acer negundo]|uniref:Uncharacterized protein n=1 Tax=Acer negundo TaxID=4023 RepID=A0AAD5IXI3_ACENE|nr:hypothetical protein LWI28_004713 [Acer negundo]
MKKCVYVNVESGGFYKKCVYVWRDEEMSVENECEEMCSTIEAKSTIVHELKETPPVPVVQEQKSGGRKNPATRPLGMIVKVKPQPKKAKINELSVEKHSKVKNTDIDSEKSPEPVKTSNIDDTNKADDVSKIGLVSYSDESEDDD